MITSRIFIAALFLATMTGCASKGSGAPEKPLTAFGCPVGSSKIGAMEDLIESKVESAGKLPEVAVNAITCTSRNDALRIDIELVNKGDSEHRIAYRFRWLDREGFAAWDEESLKPVLLYAHASRVITGLAPTEKAVDFRLFVLPQDK